MPDNSDDPEEQVSVDQLTPEEASRIIHSHRKVRYGTACWPCRQRKVKCDNKQPCENCVKREHAQLCSYKPNRSSASKAQPSASAENTSRKRARSNSDVRDANSREGPLKTERQDSWPRTIASLEDSDGAADRYLGQNSIPALLREQSSPTDKSDRVDIRQDMRPILGLDTSAPFPLMSSNHLLRLAQDISAELPSDREVMRLFRTYKEIPQPFWGFVVDIDDFESKLMVYLEERSRNAATSSTVKSPRKATAAWLAILFAVLAVGSQYHESPYHIRTRASQRYIQISFHFLRLGNFLLRYVARIPDFRSLSLDQATYTVRPSFDSIQALLLTSFVLLNDMKAEASWALTGLTCRLAQSLGLHRPNANEGREDAPPEVKLKDNIRRKLWWTCVWHDTLTSLSFDRSPMTNFPSCRIPLKSDPSISNYTYIETMHHLIEIISRRLNPESMATASYAQIVDHCEAVENLRSHACAHIQDKDQCKTALDRLQFFAIRLHTSFVISVACRPALKRDSEFDPNQKKVLVERCKINLTETVRMFLAMHQLSVIPTRSWAFTYHGLSSALLLGLLCETKTDPEVRQLQGDLIAALSATAAKEASPDPHIPTTDKDIELSGPLWRALTALKNIYDHGTIGRSHLRKTVDPSSAGGSGDRTPLQAYALTNGNGTTQPQIPFTNTQFAGIPSSSDPREDAALAMAEMQNGASLQEFNGNPYATTLPPNISLDEMAAVSVDPTQYMAPMELYDTIWGESPPDPFNGGMDPVTFDFLAQPPPGQPQQQYYF